jgi:hypothetical protein
MKRANTGGRVLEGELKYEKHFSRSSHNCWWPSKTHAQFQNCPYRMGAKVRLHLIWFTVERPPYPSTPSIATMIKMYCHDETASICASPSIATMITMDGQDETASIWQHGTATRHGTTFQPLARAGHRHPRLSER